jgi:hypothetical protein
VDQFGKEDKYFGICTMMVTLPGLPMFGHGQVEGFTEKYGMEYRRAYWDEKPDESLVDRHRRQIFPLLKKRYLFAQVQDFLLYDFYSPEGYVNEDVFAYSNKAGDERALVVYHNKFATARGWIRISAAYTVKSESGDHMLIQKRLGEGLGLADDANTYCIFRDPINNLEYIRNARELHERGLYIELEAYKCQVFTGFRQVVDNEWHQYANLAAYLNGRGVPSMDEAMKELFLQPIHTAYRELVNAGFFRWIITNRVLVLARQTADVMATGTLEQLLQESNSKIKHLMEEVVHTTHSSGDISSITADIQDSLQAILSLPTYQEKHPSLHAKKYQPAIKYLHAGNYRTSPWKNGNTYTWGVLLGWLFTNHLGKTITEKGYEEISRSWVDEWMLNKILVSTLTDLGLDERSTWRAVTLVKLLTSHHRWWTLIGTVEEKALSKPAYQLLTSLLSDSDALGYLGVNRYQDVLWFNKEAFEDLMWWLFVTAAVEISITGNQTGEIGKLVLSIQDQINNLLLNAQASGYKLEKLLDLVK